MQATSKQTWAIFCMTGWDIRPCHLTLEQASSLIDSLKEGKPFIPEDYNGAVCIRKTNNKPKDDYQKIYEEAHKAGIEALREAVPTPMIVSQHKNQLDDNSPIEKSWYVSEGACGFAWVVIKPATSSFVKWLKKKGIGGKHYYGGWSIWVKEGNQSITRKEAYAGAFVKVLEKYRINAYSQSRLD